MEKENVVHMYSGILFCHKKEWNNAICSNMDGPGDCHTDWSQTKTSIIYYLYVDLKNGTNEPISKTEVESQIQETN